MPTGYLYHGSTHGGAILDLRAASEPDGGDDRLTGRVFLGPKREQPVAGSGVWVTRGSLLSLSSAAEAGAAPARSYERVKLYANSDLQGHLQLLAGPGSQARWLVWSGCRPESANAGEYGTLRLRALEKRTTSPQDEFAQVERLPNALVWLQGTARIERDFDGRGGSRATWGGDVRVFATGRVLFPMRRVVGEQPFVAVGAGPVATTPSYFSFEDIVAARLYTNEDLGGRLVLADPYTTLVRLEAKSGAGALRLYAHPTTKEIRDMHGAVFRVPEVKNLLVLDGLEDVRRDLARDDHKGGRIRVFHSARVAPAVEVGVGEEGGSIHIETWRDDTNLEVRRPGGQRFVSIDRAGFEIGEKPGLAPPVLPIPGGGGAAEAGDLVLPGGIGGAGVAGAAGAGVLGEVPAEQLPEPGYAFIGLEPDGAMGYVEVRSGDRYVRLDADGLHGNPAKELNFVADHPEDSQVQIYYCVAEGPEAGVYLRGTARLEAGKASVDLPGHFAHVVSRERMTVHLTPRSAASRGLAATRVTPRELIIEELFEGAGSYDVDYIVHGVRLGKERYEVLRPRKDPGNA